MDEVLTIRPYFWRIIGTAAACAHKNVPFRLTSSTASQRSSPRNVTSPSFILTARASRLMPALLTRMSSRPKVCRACSTIRATSSRCETSPLAMATPAAEDCRAAAASSSPAVSTSVRNKRAPSSAKRCAVARLMPDPAPVIQATLSWSLIPFPRFDGVAPHHQRPLAVQHGLPVLVDDPCGEDDDPPVRLRCRFLFGDRQL